MADSLLTDANDILVTGAQAPGLTQAEVEALATAAAAGKASKAELATAEAATAAKASKTELAAAEAATAAKASKTELTAEETARLAQTSRDELVTKAQGFTGETFQRNSGAYGNQLLTTKKARGALAGLRKAEVITNVFVCVDVVAAALTDARLALFDKTGTLLAKTGNLKEAFGALGAKGGALESPFTITASDAYYFGILAVGTTPPSILVGTSGVGGYSAGVVGSGAVPSWSDTTEREAFVTFVPGNFPSGVAPWFAWN